jgi:hypothetical protein
MGRGKTVHGVIPCSGLGFFRYYGRRYLPGAWAGGPPAQRAAVSSTQPVAADLMSSTRATEGQTLTVVGSNAWLAAAFFC